MGTAISVMLLSDGIAFYRSPAAKRRKLEAAALDSPQTVAVPRLLVADRPEVCLSQHSIYLAAAG